MLGQIPHRENQEGSRPVYHPCIMGFNVWDLRRNLQSPLADFTDPPLQGFKESGKIQGTILPPLSKGRRVSGLQNIDAVVVGEKCYARVKACRRRESPSPGRPGIIGKVRSVALGPIDQIVPAGVSAAGRHDQKLLQFRKRNESLGGFISQNPVWNLCAHEKATGSAAKQCIQKSERKQVLKPGGQ